MWRTDRTLGITTAEELWRSTAALPRIDTSSNARESSRTCSQTRQRQNGARMKH